MTLIKFLAIVGLLSLFFYFSIAFAIVCAILDKWYQEEYDPEEDEEQAEYLEKWRKEHEKH